MRARTTTRGHVRIRHIASLIVGNNVVYPTSYGHFLHEILPRIIWMAQALPEDIPILLVLSVQIREIMAELARQGVPVPPQRLISWEEDMVLYGSPGQLQGPAGGGSGGGSGAHTRNLCLPYGSFRPMTVVAVDQLYMYGEWPYHAIHNPNTGGQNSYHPRLLLHAARRALVPIPVREEERRLVLLMKRPGSAWGRSLANHDHILAAMQGVAALASGRLQLQVFEGEGSIAEQVALFSHARAVVGPHGAGFANLLFAPPATKVVEIGWGGDGGPARRLDGLQGMWLSDVYYSLSQAMGLEYWLVLAHTGDQVSPLYVHPEHVVAALHDL